MTIVLAGGSGFLGRALRAWLTNAGHTIRVLTRRPSATPAETQWQPDGTSGPWAAALTDADAIVNLAGEGIGDKRWTAARKAALRTSRILPTRSLALALSQLPPRPRLLVNNSAVGYYGAHGDEAVTEATSPGTDFLARLCVEWEDEAVAAASASTHVAVVRSGIVLHPDGGALKTMLIPFRLGVGGPLGNGRQFTSWIHRQDWVDLVSWLITTRHPSIPGGDRLEAVTTWNATAPEPVTSAEFARVLGRVLHRPAVMPAPAFALRVVLGEFATFLITGARVLPARAEGAGFRYSYPRLEPALRQLLDPGSTAANVRQSQAGP
jgi:uncharacterized protein (TIGR01777 family)